MQIFRTEHMKEVGSMDKRVCVSARDVPARVTARGSDGGCFVALVLAIFVELAAIPSQLRATDQTARALCGGTPT